MAPDATCVDEVSAQSWEQWGGVATVLTVDGAALDTACHAVRAVLAEVDAAANPYLDASEAQRCNARPGRWTDCGPMLLDLLDAAARAAACSGGLVDPTLGTTGGRAEPGPLRQVRVDRDRSRVLVEPGAVLDLGAIGKAVAADLAASAAHLAIDDIGVLVSLGGDIATAGQPPVGGWQVRIADDHRDVPDEPEGEGITLWDGALATSSVAVRRSVRGAHVIDPRTRQPVIGPFRTVSVVAASCADANTASTAALVAGDHAPVWLASTGLPARLVRHDGAVLRLGGWPTEGASR